MPKIIRPDCIILFISFGFTKINLLYMKIAYILFNDLTLLDFVGVYDAVLRLKTMNYIPEMHWDFCALTDKVNDELGLTLLTNRKGDSLAAYDALVVPGGNGTRTLRHDQHFIEWLQTASPDAW